MHKLVSPAGPAIESDIKLRAKGKSSHLMVWRFTDAPQPLRLLHRHLPPPEWLVFVPHARIGSDLDESIIARADSIGVFRYETPAGDVVYTGSSLMNRAGKDLRTAQSAACTLSHA
jgi:hypothetical protein